MELTIVERKQTIVIHYKYQNSKHKYIDSRKSQTIDFRLLFFLASTANWRQDYEHCQYWDLAVPSQQQMAQDDMTWHSYLAFSRHGFHKYENYNLLNHSALV